MKKFAIAAVFTFAFVGFVMAEEFTLSITSIDGTTVKGKKGAKKGEGGEDVTLMTTPDCKVFKGKFDMDTKKMIADGDADKDGLKSALIYSMVDGDKKTIPEKGVNAFVTTNADGKITQIIVGGKGGKKKKGGE
jgi:hypothetical protein